MRYACIPNPLKTSSLKMKVEYQIMRFNKSERRVQLLHEQEKILQLAGKSERDAPGFEWDPEATKYMIESSPKETYTLDAQGLLSVEPSMAERHD